MLQVAICDPNLAERHVLCQELEKLLFDRVDYRLVPFDSREDLLDQLAGTAPFQLIFLEVSPLAGMEAAAKIRESAPQADLILLGSHVCHLAEGYRYHAFDVLLKPLHPARLQEVVGRYLQERERRDADFLTVRIQRCNVRLPLCQIYYLESKQRKVVVHMVESPLAFYGRLDPLEQALAGAGFLRCHQSYLVNRRHIRRLEGNRLSLANGMELPVSRTYLRGLREALARG